MTFCGPAEDPAASVVICAYLSRHRIDRALGALRNQDVDEPFEVIAVVSGDDGCESHLESAHPDVRIVSSRLRIFPGRARNLGINAARAPVIAFVPDDGVADSGWLRARLCHHRRGVPLVAGGISNGTPTSIVGTAGYYVEYTASMPVLAVLERQPVPHTLSYAHDVFDTAGMFPEIDVPGEDTLLNQRCVDLGISHVIEPAAAMGHLNPTRLRPYLSHQASHGRGLARCVMTGTIDGPVRATARAPSACDFSACRLPASPLGADAVAGNVRRARARHAVRAPDATHPRRLSRGGMGILA